MEDFYFGNWTITDYCGSTERIKEGRERKTKEGKRRRKREEEKGSN